MRTRLLPIINFYKSLCSPHNLVLLLLLSCLSFLSCKKDQRLPDEVPITPKTPEAPSYLCIDSTTVLSKVTYLDYYIASSVEKCKIDLDLDNQADIAIHFYKDLEDSLTIFTELSMETLNEETFILMDSIYFSKRYFSYTSGLMPVYKDFNEIYPKVNRYQDTIPMNGNWRKGNYLMAKKISSKYHPPYEWWIEERGNWNNAGIRYAAVKCKGKLAWIELFVYNFMDVRLTSHACSK